MDIGKYHDNRLHDSGHQKLSEDFISMDEVPQQPICEESHSDVADRDENSKQNEYKEVPKNCQALDST